MTSLINFFLFLKFLFRLDLDAKIELIWYFRLHFEFEFFFLVKNFGFEFGLYIIVPFHLE